MPKHRHSPTPYTPSKRLKAEIPIDKKRRDWATQHGHHFYTSLVSLTLMGRATQVTDTNLKPLASCPLPTNPVTRQPVSAKQNQYDISFSQALIKAINCFPVDHTSDTDKFTQLYDYVVHLPKNLLEKTFPNWHYAIVQQEIICAYRTAEEMIKIKSTFKKMKQLYIKAKRPERAQAINNQEIKVLNTVATYLKEQPTHSITLKIIMPQSNMSSALSPDEIHLLNITWQPEQNLSRIAGILIEISNPDDQSKQEAYRYLLGLNRRVRPHKEDQCLLLLKVNQQNQAPPLQRTPSTLGTLHRLLSSNSRNLPGASTFQTGLTASNLTGPLKLYLIDRRQPQNTLTTDIFDFPQQTLDPQSTPVTNSTTYSSDSDSDRDRYQTLSRSI